jgi:hypothetical protein
MSTIRNLAVLILLVSPALSAQQGQSVVPGARVRLTAGAAGVPHDGRVVAVLPDSLVLTRTGSDTLAVPRSEITDLQVWRQQPLSSHGAGVGLLVGMVIGVGLPLMVTQNDMLPIMAGGAFGGLVGTGYGAGGRAGLRRAPLGWLIGGLAGAGIGAALCAGTDSGEGCYPGEGAVILAIPTALLGGAVAAMIRDGVWDPIPYPVRVSLGVRMPGRQ